jgi:glycerophosphoryl diester phosphodiesterase
MHRPGPIEIIAHRGYSAVAPENTIAALRAAVDAGADAVEFDLQTASCGTPVLFHDPHLGRTSNGVGPVRRRTLDQLRALDVGSWFSREFEGERIPSLVEALELLAPTDLTVWAEVKGYRELEDLDRMARIVRDAGMAARTIFISLDFGIVDRIAGQDGEVGIGYVVSDTEDVGTAIGKASGLGDRGLVDYDRRLLLADDTLAARTLMSGASVATWTVDDADEAETVVAQGVRRITTNRVSELLRWRDRRGPAEG